MNKETKEGGGSDGYGRGFGKGGGSPEGQGGVSGPELQLLDFLEEGRGYVYRAKQNRDAADIICT